MTENLLKPLRTEIDKLDKDILELINKRAEIAIKIGAVKKEKSVAVFDSSREKVVLKNIMNLSKGKAIGPTASKTIFTEIIKACRAAQAPIRVSFLGPLGTFSHAAALQQFGPLAEYKLCDSLMEVFKMVDEDKADYALVPFENSTEGIVGQTLDLIGTYNLKAKAMFNTKIALSLLTNSSNLKDIKTVASHPQALAQCKAWISLNLPGVEILATSSTASAASLAMKDNSVAVIGHPKLADFYSLQITVEKIEDYSHNQTCFLIMGHEDTKATGKDRTLICFATNHKSGSLYKSLQPIADAKINMTRLHSRPNVNAAWEYLFFLEIDGHHTEENIAKAIVELEKHAEHVKVVGGYADISNNNIEEEPDGVTLKEVVGSNYNQF